MSISALSDLSDAVVAPVALNEGLLDLLLIDGAMATLKRAADGRHVWVSPSWQDWVGGEAPLPQPVANAIQAADARALASGQPMSVDDHVFERAGGRRVELRAVRRVLHGLAGEPLLLTLWRDVTALRRESLQLQQALGQIERLQQAIEAMRRQHEQGLDRPGELFRREHFEEHLRREAALSQREHREFALVLLAIDRIEAMRQSHGEAAVQRIVEMMGHLMRTNTRAMDVLSQLGEGRFAILLSGVGLATAHARMEHLRRACATQVVVQDGRSLGFEISIGIASFPHTAATLAELSQAAVRALTDARLRGGNRIALASIRLPEASGV
ncbi:GGDEF domain-containing protein [Sphaerotilus natans]|uniref:GGDEF domain-containing protein n=1 Tax=Sphaerotilus natans TaxID=34103 RepID=UPI00406C2EE8